MLDAFVLLVFVCCEWLRGLTSGDVDIVRILLGIVCTDASVVYFTWWL